MPSLLDVPDKGVAAKEIVESDSLKVTTSNETTVTISESLQRKITPVPSSKRSQSEQDTQTKKQPDNSNKKKKKKKKKLSKGQLTLNGFFAAKQTHVTPVNEPQTTSAAAVTSSSKEYLQKLPEAAQQSIQNIVIGKLHSNNNNNHTTCTTNATRRLSFDGTNNDDGNDKQQPEKTSNAILSETQQQPFTLSSEKQQPPPPTDTPTLSTTVDSSTKQQQQPPTNDDTKPVDDSTEPTTILQTKDDASESTTLAAASLPTTNDKTLNENNPTMDAPLEPKTNQGDLDDADNDPATDKTKALQSPSTIPKQAAPSNDAPPSNDTSKQADDTTVQLSEAARSLLSSHDALIQKYRPQAMQLLQHCSTLPEEGFEMAPPQPPETNAKDDETTNNNEIPDTLLPTLVALIEGRSESLSALVDLVSNHLQESCGVSFSTDTIAAKIKLLASRKSYVKHPRVVLGSVLADGKPNLYENTEAAYLWRWEVTTIDLLPPDSVVAAKRARTARKKHGTRVNALLKLLQSLESANQLLTSGSDPSTNSTGSKLSKMLSTLASDEEKVLKHEREAEQRRLAAEAKLQKERAVQAAKLQKQQALEAKRQEKEQAAALKAEKKLEAQRKKALEEEKKQSAMKKKERSQKKQQSCMMALFRASNKDTPRRPTATAVHKTPPRPSPNRDGAFDVAQFRQALQGSSSPPHAPFSTNKTKQTKQQSRRRRPARITVPFDVTVYPEEGEGNLFADQPYAQQEDVVIRNRYQFLKFHEDVRPAYYGTWSKRSAVVTGRTPFGKDVSHLDYEVDSEAEWEEGDDEFGEELGDDKADADADMDDSDELILDEDGWLAADDEIDEQEELDEETRLLRQKTLEHRNKKRVQTVCFIAPYKGRPIVRTVSADVEQCLENVAVKDAMETLQSLSVWRLHDDPVCMDPLPPAVVDETGGDSADSKNTLSDEHMKIFATFVHNCTLGSKDKVVDELVKAEESIKKIPRAQLLRVLDSMAEKKKDPCNGTFWQVKLDVLAELGLTELAQSAGNEEKRRSLMKEMALFVHHNTTTSKDKLLDTFRASQELSSNSRAEAMRMLMMIAEKQKHPKSGYYWEVKRSYRDELELNHLASGSPATAVDGSPNDNVKASTKKRAVLQQVSKPSAGKKKRAKLETVSVASGTKRSSSSGDSSESPSKKRIILDASTTEASSATSKASAKPSTEVSQASVNLLSKFVQPTKQH